jgi:hypothetical protein
MDWTDTERAIVEARLAAIVTRFGDRLDEPGRQLVRERLLELERLAAAVRSVPLTDEAPLASFLVRPAPEVGYD